MRFNIRAFSLTMGLFWGFGLFAATWWILMFDGPSSDPTFIGSLYRGYSITATGSLIGLVWAFADGAIGGALFAWIYNALAGTTKSAA